MERSCRSEPGFPHVSLHSSDGRRAVEVTLLSPLGAGAGDAVASTAGAMQARHPHFNDALDEPSARLSAPDLDVGDPAALYTFSVGSNGHPFHRHAAPRLFTAISGSGGARLRFIAADARMDSAEETLAGLQHVEVPADCLFTVRMAANTWHQFQPLHGNGLHPALFAVSCHPDETAGALDPALHAQVMRGDADLASLTELMPETLLQTLQCTQQSAAIRTTTLGFAPVPRRTWVAATCTQLRQPAERLRRALLQHFRRDASARQELPALSTRSMLALPDDSLLVAQLTQHHHQDCVQLQIDQRWLPAIGTEQLLVLLLTAFMNQPASSISGLMRLRNLLARPLRLRTSPLGCPVSSLLNDTPGQRFAQRFPVLASACSADTQQVLLGADDRHLQFRSCVAVRRQHDQIIFSLSTRVRCHNAFGHLYMAVVDPVHRHFIAPKMLRTAVGELLEDALAGRSSTATAAVPG